MAQNKGKRTYEIKDLVKAGSNKTIVSKPKVGYHDWFFKRGGWKPIGICFSLLAFVGYIRNEMIEAANRRIYFEAKTIIEQGIRPEPSVKTNLIVSEDESQFGQSMRKDKNLE